VKEAFIKVDKEHNSHGNCFFYLATAPNYFGTIVEQLAKVGLMTEENGHWRRVIIEKPFGHDLDSAKELNQHLLKVATEHQIYRIDHYLGKETVQNILALRFANGIFEPIWNRRYIDHVQISVTETVGVEQRGGYYDQAGATRDMVPNHIMQLITLTAMEPPISFEANAVRDEQAKILHAIQPFSDEDVLSKTVRGQYGEGVIDNERVPAYRSEEGVPHDSRTETFVAMRLLIDNWRWAGVPFYLRTGKRLPARNTQVVIQFRRAPFMLFRETQVENMMPNQLVLHIQPEEGISLRFAAKTPGTTMQLGEVNMDFEYSDYFGVSSSTGYERLLHDCMIGDATLFQRADMVEAGWSVVNPALDVWKALPPRNFPNYAAGTWGPKESEELMERDGRRWRNFEK
jgi:glucose-6-phosphate 1-dehydrogenase